MESPHSPLQELRWQVHGKKRLRSISSTEPEGDFDHSTLASEGTMSMAVNLLFQILALVELVFDWDFD